MARPARLVLAALLLLPARVAGEPAADAVVSASPPYDTSVTIYRAPDDRFGSTTMNGVTPGRLDGYALISEVRDVDLPAGPAVVRFAGVAAGMLAESVVVSGLPDDVREKNLDAQLLSPRHLYAGWFGRPVTLRRTDARGLVREEPAVIRSAPDGAAIVETRHGFEAVNCGPFEDSLVYPGVPDGLYASPTLSIATDAPAPAQLRLRLTYLAWDYDWRADYVLKLAPDLRHGQLSAWLTLASADVTSFPATAAAVVAGRANFAETRTDRADDNDGDLVFHCFPRAAPSPVATPPPAMRVPAAVQQPGAMDIVVTAVRKAAVAEAENLGDLKLYRLPQQTTVAARAQKQVALFEPRTVVLETLHTLALDNLTGESPARLLVRTRNRYREGLGLALPAGRVRVLIDSAGASRSNGALVVGQGVLGDRAINDRVEIMLAPTPQVQVRKTVARRGRDAQAVTVTVSNANGFAVKFLGTFNGTPPASIRALSAGLAMEDGHRVWAVLVPAHGQATLHYRRLHP